MKSGNKNRKQKLLMNLLKSGMQKHKLIDELQRTEERIYITCCDIDLSISTMQGEHIYSTIEEYEAKVNELLADESEHITVIRIVEEQIPMPEN